MPPPNPLPAPPVAGLTDYERLREENIQRNNAILASLRRKAAELTAAIQSSKPPKRQYTLRTPGAAAVRSSLRTRGLPPPEPPAAPSPPPSPPKPTDTSFSPSLASSILGAAASSSSSPAPPEAQIRDEGFDAAAGMALRRANVRKVVPERVVSTRVLPLVDRTVVAAGSSFGHIGFWDVDGIAEEDEDGDGAGRVFEYMPHRGHVSAIVAHPALPQKIYSCSYAGEICLMNLDKERFNMVQLSGHPIFSLCQAPNSPNCLYFCEGKGDLKLCDERAGNTSTAWNLHSDKINSIDFHPENTYTLATSSSDGTACMWDIRNMKMKETDALKVIEHSRPVLSAYFSPGGRMVATTSLDDTLRIFSLDNFGISDIVKLSYWKGRCLSAHSCFRAIWGWNDKDLFIGSPKRTIAVYSVDISDSRLVAWESACLQSEHMTCIPSLFSAHPYKVGYLACANTGGKVFLWTRA